jgi:hypothetical protein
MRTAVIIGEKKDGELEAIGIPARYSAVVKEFRALKRKGVEGFVRLSLFTSSWAHRVRVGAAKPIPHPPVCVASGDGAKGDSDPPAAPSTEAEDAPKKRGRPAKDAGK